MVLGKNNAWPNCGFRIQGIISSKVGDLDPDPLFRGYRTDMDPVPSLRLKIM